MLRNPLFSVYLHGSLQVNDPGRSIDRPRLFNRTAWVVRSADRSRSLTGRHLYRGLGSIDITAAVRSLLFIGKLKDSTTTRELIHDKSSFAPPGPSLAFSLGDEKGFEWIGAYDITADEVLAGTDTIADNPAARKDRYTPRRRRDSWNWPERQTSRQNQV